MLRHAGRAPATRGTARVDRLRALPFPTLLASVVLVVASLRLARPVLLPFAAAVLLSIVLAPLVRRVERLGIGRIAAVLVVTLAVAAFMGGTGWIIVAQGADLVEGLPEYRDNARAKLDSLRASLLPVEQAAQQMKELEREINAGAGASSPQQPPKVEVVDESGPLELMSDYAGSAITPLSTFGLVLVLLIFILVQREDLRDRLIRLLGSRDLHRLTTALDEGANRTMRYLRAYSLLNGGHGLVVGLGLWAFDLPAPFLFGLLSALLRFIPYVGPWIAATLPVALSFAIFDGWSTTLGIVGFLVTVELVSNNAVEPWLYGSSVGLHPFAVIVSAIFWTWIWGPLGLVLATPLSVCLVMLGRHVPQLEFLDVLLSDEPALDPPIRLYQRLLARDAEEATDLLAEHCQQQGVASCWDDLLVPTLALLEADRRRDADDERLAFAGEALEALVATSFANVPGPPGVAPVRPVPRTSVLFLPASQYGDEIVCQLLARTLEQEGFAPRTTRRVLLSEMVALAASEDVDLVCVSALRGESQRAVRHLTGRVLTAREGVDVVVGLWKAPRRRVDALNRRLDGGGRVRIVTSLAEARDQLRQLAHARELRAASSETAAP